MGTLSQGEHSGARTSMASHPQLEHARANTPTIPCSFCPVHPSQKASLPFQTPPAYLSLPRPAQMKHSLREPPFGWPNRAEKEDPQSRAQRGGAAQPAPRKAFNTPRKLLDPPEVQYVQPWPLPWALSEEHREHSLRNLAKPDLLFDEFRKPR